MTAPNSFSAAFSADYVLANPLFKNSDWHRKDEDVRWRFSFSPVTTSHCEMQ